MSAAGPLTRRAMLGGALAGATLPAALRGEILRPDGVIASVRGAPARRVMELLEQLPMAQIGSGIPVVTFSSSLCPACHRMNGQYPGAIPGLALHYAPAPIATRELGGILRVSRDPRFATYQQFMAGAFRAVPEPASAADRQAIGRILDIHDELHAIGKTHSGNPRIASGTPSQIAMPFGPDMVAFVTGHAFGIWKELGARHLAGKGK